MGRSEDKPKDPRALITSIAVDYNVSEDAAVQIIKRVTESLNKKEE